jgi:hypothetical protein
MHECVWPFPEVFVSNQSLTNAPELTHDAMQAASHRPVSGSPDSLPIAAGGGLEVPGREMHAAPIPMIGIDHATHEPIPGERDPETLTHRQPGSMSAPFNGQENPGASWPLDEQRRRELVREGGGLDAERHEKRQDKKQGDR